jgi:hypothetical protein
MANLTGLHSIYSFTGRSRYATQSYNDMYLYEALTLLLSSYHWRNYNGDIKLVCDDKFYDFITNNNLTFLWDSIDNQSFKKLPTNIDYSIFWTYPKVFAQSLQKDKFASVDADLYMWASVKDYTEDYVFAHFEVDNVGSFYPSIDKMDGYSDLFQKYNMAEAPAINTSLIVFNKQDVIHDVLDVFTKLAERVKPTTMPDWNEFVWTIFPEQKFLGNLIFNNDYKFRSLMREPHFSSYSVCGNSDSFLLSSAGILHLWSSKAYYDNEPIERENFTQQLINQIEIDYPHLMDKVEKLKKVFKK